LIDTTYCLSPLRLPCFILKTTPRCLNINWQPSDYDMPAHFCYAISHLTVITTIVTTMVINTNFIFID
jgi:hypothetical protein